MSNEIASSLEEPLEQRDIIDVTRLARKVGVCAPVAVTRALWDSYICFGCSAEAYKEAIRRLMSLLESFSAKANSNCDHVGDLMFAVQFEMGDGEKQFVELKAACWNTDTSRIPIVAMMLPEED